MAAPTVSIRPQGRVPGVERFDAAVAGCGFAPHRHDCYAVGLTLSGVQRFRYRGATWQGLPGQVHVLHADELHDGEPGTAAGFAYRMVYLDPALGGGALLFVATPLLDGVDPSPWDFGLPLDRAGGCAGLDRWTLARQFRRAYGISPSGFRVQRQVARAQSLMRAGLALAAVAAEAGFALQPRMYSNSDMRWTMA